MKNKKFPNGFESWAETHYAVVEYLTQTNEYENSMSNQISESEGTGGLFELSIELTDEFEQLYKGKEWDGEFFDFVEQFLNAKNFNYANKSKQ